MAKVFISYSRKDIEFAKKLTDEFPKIDLDFWIDWEGIPPTVDWWHEIQKGIEETDAFIFLISPDSAKSNVCAQEIEYAFQNGKRMLPLVVRDTPNSEIPNHLHNLNWIFFRETDDFKAAFAKLLTSIHTDYEWVQIHRQLQVKALEWERNNHDNSSLLRGKELQNAELQLAQNASKEPYPTDLQRDYVFRSRQASDRQRRIVSGIAIVGVIVLAALAAFGFIQADLARNAQSTAEANQFTAETAQAIAVTNEAKAVEQSHISLARQLAAQAQTNFLKGYRYQTTAALLAAESLQLFPNSDAAQVIRENTIAQVISEIKHEAEVNLIAISPYSEYVASGGGDNTVKLWRPLTGELVCQLDHDDLVNTLAFTPDGTRLFTGSLDGTARLWEVSSCTEILRLQQDASINDLAISPDGQKIITGSSDGFARIWDTTSGAEILHLAHENDVNSVTFSLDGERVLTGSGDGTARVWNTISGKEIAQMVHEYGVDSVAFSPDGQLVISGGGISARVWNSNTGDEFSSFEFSTGGIYSVDFSPNGKYVLASGGENVIVWEATTGIEIARMTHGNLVLAATFSFDGKYVISGGCDLLLLDGCTQSTARVWEALTGKEIAHTLFDKPVAAVAFSSNGAYVVSASEDFTVRVWKPKTDARPLDYSLDNMITATAFSPNGKFFASGGYDETVRVWEIETGEEVAYFPHDRFITFVAFSQDSQKMISAAEDNIAHVWDLSSGMEVFSINDVIGLDGNYVASRDADKNVRIWETKNGDELTSLVYEDDIWAIDISPDGSDLAISSCREKNYESGRGVCQKSTIKIWDIVTGLEVTQITTEGGVYRLEFDPDGKQLLSGGCREVAEIDTCQQGAAIIWDIFTGDEIARMDHAGTVYSLAFSPSGEYAASGSWDSTARVWQTTSGVEISRMTFDDLVFYIGLSPDSKYVISGGCDLPLVESYCWQGSTRVWEISTGNEISRITYEDEIPLLDHFPITGAFSPDGNFFTSSWNNTVSVQIWQANDLIANACSRVSRNLTTAEWKKFIGDALPYQAVCPKLPMEGEIINTSAINP